MQYPIGQFSIFGTLEAHHFRKGFKGCKTLIAGFGEIFALPFEPTEESQDEFRGDMLYPERADFSALIRSSEGQKEPEGIPIGFDGMGTNPLDMGKVVIEELMD